jgi:hypothetical protein
VAVALDRAGLRDRRGELLQRYRWALVVGEIPVRLLDACEVALAVGELRVVGFELARDGRALEPATGGLGHEGRDVADVVAPELELERGHRRAAVLDLTDNAFVARPERVEVGSRGPTRAGGAQRVAAAAAGVGEDLLAVLGVARKLHVRSGFTTATARQEKHEGREDQESGAQRHPQ